MHVVLIKHTFNNFNTSKVILINKRITAAEEAFTLRRHRHFDWTEFIQIHKKVIQTYQESGIQNGSVAMPFQKRGGGFYDNYYTVNCFSQHVLRTF